MITTGMELFSVKCLVRPLKLFFFSDSNVNENGVKVGILGCRDVRPLPPPPLVCTINIVVLAV